MWFGAHTLRVGLVGVTLSKIEKIEAWSKLTEQRERHVRSMRVKLVMPEDWLLEHDWEWTDKHPNLYGRLRELMIGASELEGLVSDLDRLGVSTVLKERLLKVLYLFNTGISDVTYFPSFMEMRGYLIDMIARIRGQVGANQEDRSSNQELHEWIYNRISYFERTYANRSHHSAKYLNGIDSNLEYNGGVQQLITACDYAFKSIMSRVIGSRREVGGSAGMLLVSGYENVQSDASALRVDITHLTSPNFMRPYCGRRP